MKLTIHVEVQPEEIPLATELFAILKQITQNVSIKTTVPVQSNAQILRQLIAKFEEAEQGKVPGYNGAAVGIEIAKFLSTKDMTVAPEFLDAFMAVVFNPERVERSVIPFFYILESIPEQFKTYMRENLVTKILTFLLIKRSVDCNRREFFAYAEAFSALVKLEFVSVSGAVSTLTTLVQNRDTRSAGVTMLGKTVELCLPLLLDKDKCDPQKLQELRLVIAQVKDEVFRYDISYIEQNMGWTYAPLTKPVEVVPQQVVPQPAKPTAVSPVQSTSPTPGGTLVASNYFTGHSATVFALCFDETRDQILSSGKDGFLMAWTKDGKVAQKTALAKHFACSMDLNVKTKSLFICGVSKEQSKEPALINFGLTKQGNWELRGTLERPDIKLVSCVKTLSDASGNFFATGESVKSSAGEHSCVRVYDTNAGAFNKLQPLISYLEHEDIITSIAHSPNNSTVFFSGSRDCTIKMWDRRQAKSIGMLGSYQSITGRVTAHDSMITCIDAYDHLLASGGLDKKVALWDLRTLDSNGLIQPIKKLTVDDNAILKVAIGSLNAVAVSTLKGLSLMDFAGNSSPKQAIPFKDQKPPGRYHDLKWNATRTVLFAAGDDSRIDQYILK